MHQCGLWCNLTFLPETTWTHVLAPPGAMVKFSECACRSHVQLHDGSRVSVRLCGPLLCRPVSLCKVMLHN